MGDYFQSEGTAYYNAAIDGEAQEGESTKRRMFGMLSVFGTLTQNPTRQLYQSCTANHTSHRTLQLAQGYIRMHPGLPVTPECSCGCLYNADLYQDVYSTWIII